VYNTPRPAYWAPCEAKCEPHDANSSKNADQVHLQRRTRVLKLKGDDTERQKRVTREDEEHLPERKATRRQSRLELVAVLPERKRQYGVVSQNQVWFHLLVALNRAEVDIHLSVALSCEILKIHCCGNLEIDED